MIKQIKSSPLTHQLNRASHVKGQRVHSVGVSVYIRGCKNLKPSEKGTVYLKLCYFNKSTNASTGIRCRSIDLDRERKIIRNDESSTILLQKYIADAQNLATELKITNREIDLELIKAAALGLYIEGIPSIQECLKKFLALDEKRFEMGELVAGAFRKNKVWHKQLSSFCESFYGRHSHLTDIKTPDLNSFVWWLKSKQKNSHNITQLKATYFKRMLNFAIENQWLTINPFLNFRKKIENHKKEGLSIQELKNLMELHVIDPAIDRVRECFIFQCLTGLSYKDACELQRIHILKLESGEPLIHKPRTKTGQAQTIYLHPYCVALLKKYENDQYCKANKLLLPLPTNVHMNRMLKVLGQMAGIKKVMSTHLGRHTISTALANGGASALALKEVMGHSTIEMTNRHYMTVHQQTTVREMKSAMERINIA